MPRESVSAAEMTRIRDESGRWLFKVEIRRRNEVAWTNASDVAGGDWVLKLSSQGDDPDSPVTAFTVTLMRSADGRSMSPGMSADPLNRTPADVFKPLCHPRGFVRISASNIEAATDDEDAVYREWFQGEIEEVDYPADDVELTCNSLDAIVERAWIEDEVEIEHTGDGVPVEEEVQDVLDAVLGVDAPELYVPVPTELNVGSYKREVGSGGELARNIVQRRGFDLRYDYDAADVLRYTLLLPPRDKTEPDFIFEPYEVLEVPTEKETAEHVRNAFKLTAVDDTGEEFTRTRENLQSIEDYGRSWMGIVEGADSDIKTVAQADALLAYADNDLSRVFAEKRIRIAFNPWIKRYDIVRIKADGIRFDQDATYGVVGVSHEVSEGERSTFLDLNGAGVVGQYYAWHRNFGRTTSPVPVLSVSIVATSAESVTYLVTGRSPGGDPVTLYVAMGGDDFGEATTNPVEIVLDRISASAQTRSARIKAVGRGGEAETTVSADYDLVPGIKYAPAAAPVFSGNAQSGWSQTYIVDEDARGFLFRLAGSLGIVSTTPNAVRVGDDYWINVAVVKSVVLVLSQNPGQVGAVNATPTEYYGPGVAPPGSTALAVEAAAGLQGETMPIPFRRAPVTEHVVREPTVSTRTVIFTPNPPGCTVRYRLNEGAWYVHPNVSPSVSAQDINVSAGAVRVDFYSTSADGVAAESMRSFNLDQNAAAEMEDLVIEEPDANVLTATPLVDDDTVTWALYGRRGAWPEDRAGNPDPDDLLARPSALQGSVSFWAGGDGGPTSTWYFIGRAFDANGAWDASKDQRVSFLVQGAASTTGRLTNVGARLHQEGANWYNDILWNHTDAIDADPEDYTVDIVENGVTVIAGRRASYDHDTADDGTGGVVVAGAGGAHRRVIPAGAGVDDNELTFTYDVRLKYLGAVVATYRTTLVGMYSGSGIYEPAPDPPAPPVLTIPGSGRIQATWSATAGRGYRIEWESASWPEGHSEDGSEAWLPVAEDDVGRGVSSHTLTTVWNGWAYRARLREYTNGGISEYSPYSGYALGYVSGGGGGGGGGGVGNPPGIYET